jgi:hypothetical protein
MRSTMKTVANQDAMKFAKKQRQKDDQAQGLRVRLLDVESDAGRDQRSNDDEKYGQNYAPHGAAPSQTMSPMQLTPSIA